MATAVSRGGPLGGLKTLFETWRRRRALARELQDCGEDGPRVLDELRLSPSDVAKLAANRPGDAELLPRMMDALHIDPREIARAEPGVMRDLERVCGLCEHKGECWQDLERGEAEENWRRYCANAATLDALRPQP